MQWLCNADSSAADPRKRMRRFFESLYGCLTRGGRAVLQVGAEAGVEVGYKVQKQSAHLNTHEARI